MHASVAVAVRRPVRSARSRTWSTRRCARDAGRGQTDIEDDGPRVVLTGRVEVAADEEVDTVVIFDGPAVIDGTVDGSVVALNGEIVVRGDSTTTSWPSTAVPSWKPVRRSVGTCCHRTVLP